MRRDAENRLDDDQQVRADRTPRRAQDAADLLPQAAEAIRRRHRTHADARILD